MVLYEKLLWIFLGGRVPCEKLLWIFFGRKGPYDELLWIILGGMVPYDELLWYFFVVYGTWWQIYFEHFWEVRYLMTNYFEFFLRGRVPYDELLWIFFLRCRVHPNELLWIFLGGRVPCEKLLWNFLVVYGTWWQITLNIFWEVGYLMTNYFEFFWEVGYLIWRITLNFFWGYIQWITLNFLVGRVPYDKLLWIFLEGRIPYDELLWNFWGVYGTWWWITLNFFWEVPP